MTEKLLSEGEIAEEERLSQEIENYRQARRWPGAKIIRALATIRALQEREKLLMDAATDDVGAWRTVSEHIRVLQDRAEYHQRANDALQAKLDKAAKLIRETIPYFPRVGQIPEHGVRDRLMTFLSTLKPKPDTKPDRPGTDALWRVAQQMAAECDGSGNVEFGTCPGCSKCNKEDEDGE